MTRSSVWYKDARRQYESALKRGAYYGGNMLWWASHFQRSAAAQFRRESVSRETLALDESTEED